MIFVICMIAMIRAQEYFMDEIIQITKIILITVQTLN
jgi:hypothetical protein